MTSVKIASVLLLGFCCLGGFVSCEDKKNVTQTSNGLNEPDFAIRKSHVKYSFLIFFILQSVARNAVLVLIIMLCISLLVIHIAVLRFINYSIIYDAIIRVDTKNNFYRNCRFKWLTILENVNISAMAYSECYFKFYLKT